MRNFRKYKVWELGHEVTLMTYKLTKSFPSSERFAFISQMQWAYSSVPANIAEDCGRNFDKEFCRFLFIANGSAAELEYFLILNFELSYIKEE